MIARLKAATVLVAAFAFSACGAARRSARAAAAPQPPRGYLVLHVAPGSSRLLEDPWLARLRDGHWQVAEVPHEIDDAGLKLALLDIRPGADGAPKLLYGSAAAPVTREPSGWRAVDGVSPLQPASPGGMP